MEDGVKGVRRKKALNGGAIAQVRLDEGKIFRRRRVPQLVEIGAFVGRGVIVVEVVNADHAVAALQQGVRDMAADEAGGAGDEDGFAHAVFLWPKGAVGQTGL